MSMREKQALVIFGDVISKDGRRLIPVHGTVIAPRSLEGEVAALGGEHRPLEPFIEPGSIYEASALAGELSQLTLPDGTPVRKAFTFKGFDLWWLNYQNLFTRFCLPYTQYRKLLEHLKDFESVTFVNPPFASLFSCYLRAHATGVSVVRSNRSEARQRLPLGIIVQMFLTLLAVPLAAVQRKPIMVSTGDKFETGRDYDFRMRFAYEELRRRELPFVEFVRSLESSKMILQHAWKRRRPVIYTEAVTFLARFVSVAFGGHRRARARFGDQVFAAIQTPKDRFKSIIGVQYLLTAYDDIIAIRIMEWIVRIIGVKAAFVPATTERNFHTVLGCKLAGVPTVGILHGAASRNYNLYEFTPGFDGERRLSVDRYGVWSQWWKEYFEKYGNAYAPEQIFVSGPMRPIQKTGTIPTASPTNDGRVKVLLVSEVVAIPTEVVPYLDTLLATSDFSVHIKFRATHDSFEQWLIDNRPDILAAVGSARILKGTMQEAITVCDVVVGCQSTGVIEATLQNKPFVFFRTNKWGDYFDMKSYDPRHHFFAENSEELIRFIREGKAIPHSVLETLRERFFGDPYKNGSAWVIDELVSILH